MIDCTPDESNLIKLSKELRTLLRSAGVKQSKIIKIIGYFNSAILGCHQKKMTVEDLFATAASCSEFGYDHGNNKMKFATFYVSGKEYKEYVVAETYTKLMCKVATIMGQYYFQDEAFAAYLLLDEIEGIDDVTFNKACEILRQIKREYVFDDNKLIH
jgi:hypothetical protein